MVKFTEYKENKKIKPESGEHNGNTGNDWKTWAWKNRTREHACTEGTDLITRDKC